MSGTSTRAWGAARHGRHRGDLVARRLRHRPLARCAGPGRAGPRRPDVLRRPPIAGALRVRRHRRRARDRGADHQHDDHHDEHDHDDDHHHPAGRDGTPARRQHRHRRHVTGDDHRSTRTCRRPGRDDRAGARPSSDDGPRRCRRQPRRCAPSGDRPRRVRPPRRLVVRPGHRRATAVAGRADRRARQPARPRPAGSGRVPDLRPDPARRPARRHHDHVHRAHPDRRDRPATAVVGPPRRRCRDRHRADRQPSSRPHVSS